VLRSEPVVDEDLELRARRGALVGEGRELLFELLGVPLEQRVEQIGARSGSSTADCRR